MKMYLAALMLHASLSFVSGDLMEPESWRGLTRQLSLLRKEMAELSTRVAKEKRARRAQVSGSLPTIPSAFSTFFIPLDEQELLDDAFSLVDSSSGQVIISLFSVAVPLTGTVIWYDHFEDGYDNNGVTDPINHVGSLGGTTEVWGDGNATNGCEPNQDPCTDETDVLQAGSAIVVEEQIDLSQTSPPDPYYYNGKDKIVASLPVAVTRGAYPERPGSVLAGAVEVLGTEFWGTKYTMPLDNNSPTETNATEIAGYFIMAEKDDTLVTLPNSTVTSLDQGETLVLHNDIAIGNKITSTEPIQVHIITGDEDSDFEMRWFSLMPSDEWKNSYLSPVGNDEGDVKVTLYNPNEGQIKVKYDYLDDNGAGAEVNAEITMEANTNARTVTIPTGTGVKFYSDDGEPFAAYVFVDSASGTDRAGQVFDWGFPATPVEDLTPSVLIGWGDGCNVLGCINRTGNGPGARNLVWVSPVENATVYVDYTGDGFFDTQEDVRRLSTATFENLTPPYTLSGALIWAENDMSEPVNIAVAWGQYPPRSSNTDISALDLGTVIPPLPSVSASKSCELTEQNSLDTVEDCLRDDPTLGDTITYRIFITASGAFDIAAGILTITDELDTPFVEYVEGSMKYFYAPGLSEPINDDLSGTAFPLDGSGFTYQQNIARGDTHRIEFEVKYLTEKLTGPQELTNTGNVTAAGGGFAETAKFVNLCALGTCTKRTDPPTVSPTPGPRFDSCPEEE